MGEGRMVYDVNSDNRTADLLIQAKAHVRKCEKCNGAIRIADRDGLCPYMMTLLLTFITQYDRVIPRRLTAKRSGNVVIYSCPDLSMHGKAYALTAEPLVVKGVQDKLF